MGTNTVLSLKCTYQEFTNRSASRSKTEARTCRAGYGGGVEYWRRFSYDPAQWAEFDEEKRALVARLDGWSCFIRDNRYERYPDPGEGRTWAEFPGAHDLAPFGAYEAYAPVPCAALVEEEDQSRSEAEQKTAERAWRREFERLEARRASLLGVYRSNETCREVDLGSMRGFAGLILPDSKSGVRYSWLTDGVALRWMSCRGYFIPIQGWASERLHRAGENIYRNDHSLDEEFLNDILSECLDGWAVDHELTEVSLEAAVWCRCARRLKTTQEWIEEGRGADKDDMEALHDHMRHSTIHSPFSGYPIGDEDDDDLQKDLIGRRAVLVWGNSD